MTKAEIEATAKTLAFYVRKCGSDAELIELLTAQLDLVYCSGKIAGGEQVSERLGHAR